MNRATSLKAVSAYFVTRLSAAAMVASGFPCAFARAWRASASPCDLGAGPLGCAGWAASCGAVLSFFAFLSFLSFAIRPVAPVARTRMPMRIVRFISKLLRFCFLLFRTLYALRGGLLRRGRRAFHLQCALKV